MKFSVIVTNVSNDNQLKKTLDSLKGLKYLSEILVKTDINLNKFQFKNPKIKIIKDTEPSDKYSVAAESSANIIYQLNCGNKLAKKSKTFFNNKDNLRNIQNGHLYLPAKVTVIVKNKFFKKLQISTRKKFKFINKNIILDRKNVIHKLENRDNEFSEKNFNTVLNADNVIFTKEDYLNFCHNKLDKSFQEPFSGNLDLIYIYLKNDLKLFFTENFENKIIIYKDNLQNIDNSRETIIKQLKKIIELKEKSSPPRNNQRLHFITYGTKNFRIAKSHILKVANHSGIFKESYGYNNFNLSNDFKNEFNQILSQKRGAGYWIWKHEIISRTLDDLKEGDILIYSDAGSSFNYYAKNRLFEYIEMLNDTDYGNFRIECESIHKENQWTTSQLFDYFNIDPLSEVGDSVQLEATHMIFKKNKHTSEYFNEYKKLLKFDPHLITDKYNNLNQSSYFKENRHDQSIFSLLTKTLGGVVIKNETEFKRNYEEQYNYPFLAVRKHGHGMRDSLKFLSNLDKKNNQPIYFN